MAFSRAGNDSPTAQINITPLIDVLLVLIIVFMVVVSMSQEKGLDAEIPQPDEDRSQHRSPERTNWPGFFVPSDCTQCSAMRNSVPPIPSRVSAG